MDGAADPITTSAVTTGTESHAEPASAPVKNEVAVHDESDDAQNQLEDEAAGSAPEEDMTVTTPTLTSEAALERALDLVDELQHTTVRFDTVLDEATHREAALEHKLTTAEARLACLAISNERLLLAAEDRDARRQAATDALVAARRVVDTQSAWISGLQHKLTALEMERDNATRKLQLARDATRVAELAKAYSDHTLVREQARLEVSRRVDAALKREVERLEARARDLQLESAAARDQHQIAVDAHLARAMASNEQLHAQLEDHAASRLAGAAALDEARNVVNTQADRIDELERKASSLADDCDAEVSTSRDTIRKLERSKTYFVRKSADEEMTSRLARRANKALAEQVEQLETQVHSLQLETTAVASAAAEESASSTVAPPTHPLPSLYQMSCGRSRAAGTLFALRMGA